MDDFKGNWFSNRDRYVCYIEYATLKMTVWINCIGDDTADIGMFGSLKDGREARFFLQEGSLARHTFHLLDRLETHLIE